ncbi:MAG: ShlB/FhaC/HecB family hemolysin secretion/activation protein [Gammaproteobacteria bacterium]|nr:ShlB/FhaC/HecB family hemolysin secretion/activation protein [Gammaproteobacteria bacterium]
MRLKFQVISILLIGIIYHHCVIAQDIPIKRGLNLPQLQQPDFLPKKDTQYFDLPTVPIPQIPKVTAQLKVSLTKVVFEGNTVIDNEVLVNRCKDYIDRPVSLADLELLRQKLSRYYIDQGYINSGVIFTKPISPEGILYFKVIEGELSEVLIKGNGRLNPDYLSKRLLFSDDGPLNVNRLRNRFQLLLDDPLLKKLNARITPSDNRGEALLNLDVELNRPYQVVAYVNNHQTVSTGGEVYGIEAFVRNLTQEGDKLALKLTRPIQEQETLDGNIRWDMPVNYLGTDISIIFDESASQLIEEPMSELDVENSLSSKQFGISHRLINNLQHQFSIGLDFLSRKSKTTVAGQPFSFLANETTGTVKANSLRFWQEYSYRSNSKVLALRSTFTRSKSNLQDEILTESERYSQPKSVFWIGQFHLTQRLNKTDWQFNMRATAQLTDDKLLNLDALPIGGANSVRGYRENQLLRDKGYFLNLELKYPLVQSSQQQLSIIPFIDFGRAWNIDEKADFLSSAGLSLMYKLNRLNLNLILARKIDQSIIIKEQSGNLQDEGVHFQLSYNFFD